MIRGLAILLFCQWLGEVIKLALALPLPGPVLGMLILLMALFVTRGPKPDVEAAAAPLIRHLSVLFLPPAVGLFFLGPEFADQWLAVVAAIIVGTAATVLFCGLLLKWLTRGAARE